MAETTDFRSATHVLPPVSPGTVYAPLPDGSHDGIVQAHAVQTIAKSAEDLYALWHDLERIPRWQEHVISVTRTGERTSHWVMGDPDNEQGKRVEFESEMTDDVPGQRIGWRSTSPDVTQSGFVTFEPARSGRGTMVILVQGTEVPGGELGNAIAGLIARSPRQTVIENLRHFKQLAETGEIPSVKGQPHGPRGASGGIKTWLYGETNPTPNGSDNQA